MMNLKINKSVRLANLILSVFIRKESHLEETTSHYSRYKLATFWFKEHKGRLFWYFVPIIILLLSITLFLSKEERKQNITIPTGQHVSANPLRIRVSIPYWDQKSAYESFQRNILKISDISFFWYYLSEDGSIQKYNYADVDRSLIDFAHQSGVRTSVVVANLGDDDGSEWSSERVKNVIGDAQKRTEHIHNIISLITDLDADGVSIDYEELDNSLRDEYSRFLEELSSVMKKNNKRLGVALHPKNSDSDKGLGKFQDWEKIGKYADEVYIMSYNEHWDESEAGPIASISWVEEVLNYAVSTIDPNKIFLGIPLYGYDWNKNTDSSAVGLTFEETQILQSHNRVETQWSNEYKSPYFFYDDGEDTHEVWFENAKSVMGKKLLAEKIKILGITMWRLGGEDPKIWQEMEIN